MSKTNDDRDAFPLTEKEIEDLLKAVGFETIEKVDHPNHYNQGKIEVIDFIEDQKLNFNLGNVLKYLCRANHKGDKKEDLAKALWYLQREIDHE